jgi:Protein of unknown function (DUF3465)
MQPFVKLVLLSVLVSSLPSASLAQKSGRKTSKPSPSRIICNVESVPNGMVVVGYKRNSACSDGAELLVKRPENGDIICEESPVPPQFSISTEAQGSSIGSCPVRAFLILRTGPAPATGRRATRSIEDDPIARAFASGTSNTQVEGEGTVIRLLPDDLNGSRHQRFILELASGQTLLVTHNIDIAPRIASLEIGDSIRFSGEYIWNAKGGLIHWTHHDPKARHITGWIVHNGKTYQ